MSDVTEFCCSLLALSINRCNKISQQTELLVSCYIRHLRSRRVKVYPQLPGTIIAALFMCLRKAGKLFLWIMTLEGRCGQFQYKLLTSFSGLQSWQPIFHLY